MLDADEPSPSPDLRSELLDLIWSGWKTQAIYVAAELGVADELGAGSLDAAELAGRVACQPASLERLMRSLASLGICEQHADRRYALTPLGDLLRSDTPTSLRSWACLWGQSLWDTWGGLLYSVSTGSSARARATGQVGYTHLIADSGRASTFNSSMSELTRLVACSLAESIDLRGVERVVDVGGGQGELLAAVLQRHEHVHGTVFDLAHALESARERLRRMNLEARCQVLEGDFFESVPVGAQGYVLKSVLHNWADDKAGIILRNCHRAMSPDARLFVVERVLPDQVTHCAEHQAALRSDLNMLVGPGGRERDATEMAELLECGGFEILRSWPLAFGFRAIELRLKLPRFRGHLTLQGTEESKMLETRPPYPAEFRQRLVDCRGRTPAELSREFGCSAQTIANWAASSGEGRRGAAWATPATTRRPRASSPASSANCSTAAASRARPRRARRCSHTSGWYNPRRRRSALGYRSPAQFERLHPDNAGMPLPSVEHGLPTVGDG